MSDDGGFWSAPSAPEPQRSGTSPVLIAVIGLCIVGLCGFFILVFTITQSFTNFVERSVSNVHAPQEIPFEGPAQLEPAAELENGWARYRFEPTATEFEFPSMPLMDEAYYSRDEYWNVSGYWSYRGFGDDVEAYIQGFRYRDGMIPTVEESSEQFVKGYDEDEDYSGIQLRTSPVKVSGIPALRSVAAKPTTGVHVWVASTTVIRDPFEITLWVHGGTREKALSTLERIEKSMKIGRASD